jgi:hypothetical protein
LLKYRIASASQEICEKLRNRSLITGRRFDVNQRPRKRDCIYWLGPGSAIPNP